MSLRTTIKTLLLDDGGATAVEYGLIAALIAMALVTVFDNLSNTVTDMYAYVETKASEGMLSNQG